MSKTKIARVAGFTVAAGATATLVGFAATGTGAYFSAAADGNSSVSTGSVSLATGDISNLDFTNLLPGDFKSNQISYRATGTGPEDIYLAFDSSQDAPLNALNSPPNGPNQASPLGRYGHLEVDGSQGNFQSYNLATNPSASAPGATVAGDCNINPDTGLGGSDQQADRAPNGAGTGALSLLSYCPAPQYILLSKNLQAGDGLQSAKITFGFTKVMDDNTQQASDTSHIPFRIVAEQAGVLPSNPDTTNGH
jgi:hypothetical protein